MWNMKIYEKVNLNMSEKEREKAGRRDGREVESRAFCCCWRGLLVSTRETINYAMYRIEIIFEQVQYLRDSEDEISSLSRM